MHSKSSLPTLLPLLSAGLAGLLLAAPLASAAADDPVSHFAPDGIEIDGDYLNDDTAPGEDWWSEFEPFRDPTRQDDDTLCGTSPAPKNDLTNSYVANNFDYLYMGMERLANRGNASFFFNFDIEGDGDNAGDFIFVFCFGSGETVTDTYVLEYDEVLGEFRRDSTPPEVVFAVNTERVLAPYGALDRHGRPEATIGAGKFGEARVTLADIEGFDVCNADSVVLEIQTKSSCSLSSQCKDTTGPIRFTFTPLTAGLEVSQPDACEPVVIATAHASSPRLDLITYRWFVNGEDVTDTDPAWATSDSISIDLGDGCGPTTVAVVVDDGSCTVEGEDTLDVNRGPEAAIGQATVGSCDGLLVYSAVGSTDCNGDVLTYAWDFDGDGLTDSTAEAGTWAYSSCGERAISLSVSDGLCDSEPVSTTAYVNEAPEAGLVVLPSDLHCLEISWETTATDCDLTRSSTLYTEALTTVTDFGDGSAPVADGAGIHRYAACGTYLVTTTATDASGCEDILVRTVTIDVVTEIE